MSKDYFSDHAKLYAIFRPTYPDDLYQFVYSHVKNFDCAWDCATGNGQVAHILAQKFNSVNATDISQQQLANATQAKNISYSISPAEKTPFEPNTFDLITVAQAMHWLAYKEFFNEAKRVGKPKSILAIWGYNLIQINAPINELILDLYKNTVGAYWDQARGLVDDEYRTMNIPFEEIHAPKFEMKFSWTIQHLAGYLETWSATQKFIKEKNHNPVPDVIQQIKKHWTSDPMPVLFPLFTRIARL